MLSLFVSSSASTELIRHQEKIQGKYDYMVEFASTPGGQCAYERDLFAIPIAATISDTTANLHLLDSDGWLSNLGNRVLLKWPVGPKKRELGLLYRWHVPS